jgi:hypothetical protein
MNSAKFLFAALVTIVLAGCGQGGDGAEEATPAADTATPAGADAPAGGSGFIDLDAAAESAEAAAAAEAERVKAEMEAEAQKAAAQGMEAADEAIDDTMKDAPTNLPDLGS